MATPHVAGVVSLMYALDPTLTRSDIVGIFNSTADTCAGCNGKPALAADPDGTELERIDASASKGIARGLNRHGGDVFIGASNGFFGDRAAAESVCPDSRDFAAGESEARDIRTVADNADGTVGVHGVVGVTAV